MSWNTVIKPREAFPALDLMPQPILANRRCKVLILH